MSTEAAKKKYDRQIRVWGAHGQARLESARVCLLGAGPTGAETLKNLVLGGIEAFTVVDDAQVQAADLGNNFLLDAGSLGRPRAQAVTELLKELNPAVAGSFVEDSAAAIVESRPDFFAGFRLVVAAQVGEQLAARLDEACRSHGAALIWARAYGLVGFVRPSLAEHTIIESKPDYPEEDLRLERPWPALQAIADAVTLEGLDDAAHAHVPFAVLLIKAVQAWREAHGPELPVDSQQKAAFRAILRGWQRQADGVPIEEDNFSEAMEHRRLAKLFAPPGIPAAVQAILDAPAAEAPSGRGASDFWILAAALRQFVAAEGGGSLPLEGSIPDMTATTAAYLGLQRAYRERADTDVTALTARVRALEAAAGRGEPRIPEAFVRHFAKNARNLRLVRFASVAQEAACGGGPALLAALDREEECAGAALYLLLRAADRFQAQHGRFPGSFDGSLEEDVSLLKPLAAASAAEAGAAPSAVPDDLVAEAVRCGAGELHAVAAVVGGIAAQEAIKLLTAQFVPLGGSLVYNGMAGTCLVLPTAAP